jgi:DNA-binding transcriptional ArsR family regulator
MQNLALKLGVETGWIDGAQGVAFEERYLQLFAPMKQIVKRVGSEAFVTLLYLALASESDERGRIVCDFSAGEIAEERGLRRQTVSEHIKKLKKAGLVSYEQERGAHHTFGESRYVIYPFADSLSSGSQLRPLPAEADTGIPEELAAANKADSGSTRLPSQPVAAKPNSGEEAASLLPLPASAGSSEPRQDVVAVASDEEDNRLSGDPGSGLADQAAIAALHEHGVIRRMARKLVREHGAEACLRQLAWLAERPNVKDAAAFLVRAVEEDFTAPPERLNPPPLLASAKDRDEDQAEVEAETVRAEDCRARLDALSAPDREARLLEAEAAVLDELREQEFLRLMLDRGERPAWVSLLIEKRAADGLPDSESTETAASRLPDAAAEQMQLGLLSEGAA